MVAQLNEETWRRAGCDDACTRRMVIIPGLLGRQTIVEHDPAAHELWGQSLAESVAPDAALHSGPLVFSQPEGRLWVSGREVILTRTEMHMLRVVVAGRGRVVSKEKLLDAIWGISTPSDDTHKLRVHLARLRGRLGPAGRLIVTVFNQGYRFLFLPPGETPPALVIPRASPIGRTRWAKRYDACRRCGTTERIHAGKGYCARCYRRPR